MKKIYLILIIAFFGTLNAQTQFGVKAGYNLSNMKWSVSGFDDMNFGSYSYFYVYNNFYVGYLEPRSNTSKIFFRGHSRCPAIQV